MRRPLLALLALPLLLAAADGARPDRSDATTIQPGVFIETAGSLCTLNWIFDEIVPEEELDERKPRVLAGTAAHCVDELGEAVALATPVTPVTYQPGPQFGTVVHVDDDLDFALVEVDPAFHASVDPALKGHPSIPTGLTTRERSNIGDLLQFSGNGLLFNATATTREERIGVLSDDDGRWWWSFGGVTPGDSGGPVANLTDGGTALGLVTAVAAGYDGESTTGFQAGPHGVSLEGALRDAAEDGWHLELRTVGG